MNISTYQNYLVSNRNTPNRNSFTSHVVSGDQIGSVFNSEDTVDISIINTYEIYVGNPHAATGWEIKLVQSTDNLIKQYPSFGCIITKNDSQPKDCEDFLDFDTFHR